MKPRFKPGDRFTVGGEMNAVLGYRDKNYVLYSFLVQVEWMHSIEIIDMVGKQVIEPNDVLKGMLR